MLASGRRFCFAAASTVASASSSAAASALSPVKRMFFGDLDAKAMFPFPCALSAERVDSLESMAEPVGKFFATSVNSGQIDWDHSIPADVMDGLRSLGLFGLQIPEEFGGLGFSNTEYARMVEEITADASIAVTLMAHQSIGLKGILMYGTPEQKARYLPRLASGEHIAAFALTEPGAGSDAASIRTRATPTPDGKAFLLNGNKMWISNGGIADIYTVFAQTPMPDGTDKITAFIVERAFGGIHPGKPEEKLGIRASNTVALAFEDCRVPRENVLTEVGGGFRVAVNILNNGRFGLGAGTAGGMKKMLQMIVDHTKQRKQFGRPLADFGLVKSRLADIAIGAYVAESLAYMTTALIDNGAPDASLEAAICKIYGSEAMWMSVNHCISLMGGLGFADGPNAPPFSRILRDGRILSIFEGENNLLRLFIALQGVRAPGADLAETAKALKSNPLGAAAGFLPTLLADQCFARGWSSAGVALRSPGATPAVDPALASHAARLGELTAAHGSAVRAVLTRHGKGIVEQQLLLERLADNAIDLFASAAVLSRASTSAAQRKPGAAAEARLASVFATRAAARIKTRTSELFAGRRTTDSAVVDIANDAIEAGQFVPVHPLRLASR